jgi:hypothetical protein
MILRFCALVLLGIAVILVIVGDSFAGVSYVGWAVFGLFAWCLSEVFDFGPSGGTRRRRPDGT